MGSTCLLLGTLVAPAGGGSGIGRAVCEAFSREGARVAVADVNKEAADITTLSLTGEYGTFEADVSSGSSVTSLFENVKKQFSQTPCIAVNCAGITRDTFLVKMEEKAFDDVINVNLKGTFLIGQAAARNMIEKSVTHGSIVNISSIVGKTGNLGQCNYAASKAGVTGLTKTMAKELAEFNIRVNVIMPGFIETPMVESVPVKVMDALIRQIPARRMGKPQDIADACVFLASERSRYITGTTLEVTGGLFM